MSATKKTALKFDIDAAPAPRMAPAAAQPKAESLAGDARKQVGARIMAATYRQLKARAAMQDKAVGDLVEQAITEFLANHPA